MVTAHEALAGAVLSLLDAGRAAEHRVRLFGDTAPDLVKEAREDALAALSEYDIDSAVTEGIRRYEEGDPRGD